MAREAPSKGGAFFIFSDMKLKTPVLRELGALLLMGLALFAGPVIDLSGNLSWHDQQRIAQIGLLVLAALGMLTIWREDVAEFSAVLPRWVEAAFAGAFGLGLVSALLAEHPRYAALEWATLLLLLWVSLLLAMQASRGSVSFDVWASRLVVALSVVLALKVMTGYLVAVQVVGRLDTTELFGGIFTNRRFFGQVASLMVPLLAYPLLRGGQSKSAQAALFALLAVWWMLVIASGTRGTWISLAVAGAVLTVLAPYASAPWLRIQAIAAAMGMLLFGILFVWLPGWLSLDVALESRLSNMLGLNGRSELWASAWMQIQAHPWLGIGPMHLAAIRMQFGAHPHNAALQLAAEWGVPAALALMLPAAIGVWYLLARLRQRPDPKAAPNMLLVSLVASLLAAGAQSMVDGVIVMPYTQTCLSLIAGWALGVYFRAGVQAIRVRASRGMRVGIPVLSVLAIVALLAGVVPELFNHGAAAPDFSDARNPTLPRYWLVGQIPQGHE